MGEVDHAHEAEDDGQSEGGYQQHRADGNTVEQAFEKQLHGRVKGSVQSNDERRSPSPGSSLKSSQAVIRESELVLLALGGVGPVASEALGAGLELVPGLRSHRTIGGFEDLELTVSSDLTNAHGL